ncbi:MAG: hypothetical protein GQ528_07250, partial [Woeseiaceae bacterium]|nr:hypothetical protein [Woeseiaceae bacterium]
DASVSAIKNRRSVTTAGPLNESLSRVSPATSKLVLLNVGGMLGLFEADESLEPLVRQLANSCDKTTILFRTQEELNNFNVRTEISGLPPVGQIMGPAMQLSKLVSQIKAQSREQARTAKIAATVMNTTQPPDIDGKPDAVWSKARRYWIRNNAYSPASDSADLGANFRAMWDADNLYVLVKVTDESLRNDSDEFWLDDSVEVFIDADNSKSAEYGDNDYQYYFEWAETNPGMGEFKHGRIEGVEFAAKRTETGYRTEIRIPWSTLGANPSVGAKIGLDVHVNDDDDGGDRDTKLMWRGVQDNASQSPRALGTAELAGLIGWWKFDGNANDSSGYANHGAENGNPTYVAGKFGQAISFDGKSDRIEVPATVADNPELFPAAAISASAWVKATVSANASLIRHEFHFTPLQTHGGGAKAAAFLNQNGSRALRIMSSDWSKISDGKWHHYAVTYNYGIHEVWIDGTKEVSNNLGSFPLWTKDNQPWMFGGREHVEGKDDEYYPGELDDVRLYNYALSKDEIEALHNEGK